MKILLATSEVYPYSKTGGLADMLSALSKTLARQGHEVGVVTPLYGSILDKFPEIKKMDWELELPLDWHQIQGGVHSLKVEKGLTYYFIEQEEFFNRPGIYQHNGLDYPDNPERFIFFSKAVAHLAQFLPWKPDLVHVHDWQTALVPLLLKHAQGIGLLDRSIPTCLTIHNLVYQGVFPAKIFAMTNLPWGYFNPSGSEFYGNFNFLKSGIVFADRLTTVSPGYAKEIMGAEYGANLNGVLYQRANALTGILNGADYEVWNTSNNPALEQPYSVKNVATGKARNKELLQQTMGLTRNPKIPLFGNIGRMADQKGMDILLPALEDMLAGDIQFVCLGNGSARYEAATRELQSRFPHKVGLFIGYDAELAHQITAGSDFFLMPSRYEPCGLNQMYSLRYGTLPIVRATGGLMDTVVDPNESSTQANGFKFSAYTSQDLARTMIRALSVYYSSAIFKNMRKNAMQADFSWDQTARRYEEVYKAALGGTGFAGKESA
jgi:starch synthase